MRSSKFLFPNLKKNDDYTHSHIKSISTDKKTLYLYKTYFCFLSSFMFSVMEYTYS